jgi:hypothetical protein
VDQRPLLRGEFDYFLLDKMQRQGQLGLTSYGY